MSMSNIDTSTLIHVGVELVVVGGLAFWVHRKTSNLQDKLTELNEKVNRYEDILKRQGELIAAHENALRQIFSVLQLHEEEPVNHSRPKRTYTNERSNINKTFSKARNTSQPKPRNVVKKSSISREPKFRRKQEPESDQNESEDETNTGMDDMLAEELKELRSGNSKGITIVEDESEIIEYSSDEEECDVDGSCNKKK